MNWALFLNGSVKNRSRLDLVCKQRRAFFFVNAYEVENAVTNYWHGHIGSGNLRTERLIPFRVQCGISIVIALHILIRGV